MKQKILLIEDDKLFLENMIELLELYNYGIFAAPDGIEGVKQALDKCPDLILCDVMMPGLDGFSILQFIRTNPILSDTYFVFFSACAQKSEIQLGFEMGANDYLVKPFTENELLICLEKFKQMTKLKQHDNETPGLYTKNTPLKFT